MQLSRGSALPQQVQSVPESFVGKCWIAEPFIKHPVCELSELTVDRVIGGRCQLFISNVQCRNGHARLALHQLFRQVKDADARRRRHRQTQTRADAAPFCGSNDLPFHPETQTTCRTLFPQAIAGAMQRRGAFNHKHVTSPPLSSGRDVITSS